MSPNSKGRLQRNGREILLYGGLLALQKGAGLLMLPLTTRLLSVAEYGLLEAVLVVLAFCSLLEISAGALPRFYADSAAGAERASLLASSLSLSALYGCVLGCIVALALQWWPGDLFTALTTLQLLMIGVVVALMVTLQPLQVWLRIEARVLAYVGVIGGQTLLQVGLALALLLHGWALDGILLASVVALSMALVVALYLTRDQWRAKVSAATMRITSAYQSCLIGSSLALFVMHGLDRLLLANWLGTEVLAKYAVMIKLVEVVAVCFGVLESWWLPRRFTLLRQENGARQVLQVHLGMLAALLLLLLSAASLAPPLLRLVLPEPYLAGLSWLPYLLSAVGLKLATGVFDMGCYLPQRPVWLARINAVAALCALSLYWLLIPQLGVIGLLLALHLVLAIRLLVFALISHRYMPLNYPYLLLLGGWTMAFIAIWSGLQSWLLLGLLMLAVAFCSLRKLRRTFSNRLFYLAKN